HRALTGRAGLLGEQLIHERIAAYERLLQTLAARLLQEARGIAEHAAEDQAVHLQALEPRGLGGEVQIAGLEGHVRSLVHDGDAGLFGDRGQHARAEDLAHRVLDVVNDGRGLDVVLLHPEPHGRLGLTPLVHVHAEGPRPVRGANAGLGGRLSDHRDLDLVAEGERNLSLRAREWAHDREHALIERELAGERGGLWRLAARVLDEYLERHTSRPAPGIDLLHGDLDGDAVFLAPVGEGTAERQQHADPHLGASELLGVTEARSHRHGGDRRRGDEEAAARAHTLPIPSTLRMAAYSGFTATPGASAWKFAIWKNPRMVTASRIASSEKPTWRSRSRSSAVIFVAPRVARSAYSSSACVLASSFAVRKSVWIAFTSASSPVSPLR